MKCLVTGSEGFIGRNLCERLLADGHQLWRIDPKLESDVLDVFEVDGMDVVFHLACINQMEATKSPHLNIDVNAFGAKIMAERAARAGVRFIYTSTASVYGNASRIPTPEWAELSPLTDYAVAKLAGEHFVRNSGADYTIFRLSNVYGPHQTLENPYCGVIGRFFEQARLGLPLEIVGDGSQTRDFTYVGDVVDALVKAGIEKPGGLRDRTLNLSYGDETPIIRVAMQVMETCGVALPLLPIDPRPIDGVSRRCLDNRESHARNVVCRTSLKKGLKQTHSWFNES